MSEELAYALITPYSLLKSRTGGIIARLLAHTRLELVATRMYAFSDAFVDDYSKIVCPEDTDPVIRAAWQKYLDGCANHWMPQEVNMTADIALWKTPEGLTDDERPIDANRSLSARSSDSSCTPDRTSWKLWVMVLISWAPLHPTDLERRPHRPTRPRATSAGSCRPSAGWRARAALHRSHRASVPAR